MRLCHKNEEKTTSRKLVVCGDGATGKTSLLSVFTRDYFPNVYEPTVFENYVQEITVQDQTVELSLWDTAGQEEFDRIRLLSYENTHVYMLCFSVENHDSFQNIPDKWLEEVTEHGSQAKVVLVALKCDLRSENHLNTISYEEGLDMAKSINAVRYLECSAKLNRGVKECFQETAKVALSVRSKSSNDHKSKCIIL
ncbi:small GTPase superfamily [Gilbertella persicaria]|uniref:small GTPase superfamily n=1 Tax=Gilbertella persicaria TaxID=101096 RepID=UPI0022208D05|nr:small GTPase superfamily [Gilbertella persicaria]KAI8067621.1 small GTPase superfamily [Gilbertella persicaria]